MPPSLRVLEGQVRTYRHTWRGSIVSTFVSPVLFLGAMGLGLGSLVETGGAAQLGGVAYLPFVATGLLAASAMQTAAGDASFPIMAGMKWHKTYHAALATPVLPRDLVLGHFAWITAKLTVALVVFAVIMSLFGAAPLGRSLLATPAALLTGLAFAAPIAAFACRLDNDYWLSALFRFGIVPLFLFSETFFPIDQLPGWAQPLALLSPLWHGVQLVRGVTLGLSPSLHPLLHLVVLAGCLAGGLTLTIRGFRKRLIT